MSIVIPARHVHILLSLILIACSLCCGCFVLDDSKAESETGQSSRDLTVPEARFLIEKSINSTTFIIIDTREAAEYQEGHIAGAINVGYHSTEFSNELNALNHDYQYLIYSADDQQSANVQNIMEDIGFSTLYRLEGGYAAWVQAGYPVVTPSADESSLI